MLGIGVERSTNGLPLVRVRICQGPYDCHSWSNNTHPYRPMHPFIIASAAQWRMGFRFQCFIPDLTRLGICLPQGP